MPRACTAPWVSGLLALALWACPSTPSTPVAGVAGARGGLKVSLPDGWKATQTAKGLAVGPGARTVLELEPSARPLPGAEALESALLTESARVVQKEQKPDFIGVRYQLEPGADGGASAEGFLGVRLVGKKSVWCATTAGASAPEVAQAMTVCARLSWDAAD